MEQILSFSRVPESGDLKSSSLMLLFNQIFLGMRKMRHPEKGGGFPQATHIGTRFQVSKYLSSKKISYGSKFIIMYFSLQTLIV